MSKTCFAAIGAAILFGCGGAQTDTRTRTSQRSEKTQLFYFYTCGAPICELPTGASNGGLRACTTERAGDPCDQAGDECDPGTGCSVRLRCTDSDPTAHGCPISREQYKEGIEYLSNQQLERYHDELVALPLATYRYKSGGPEARKHLGFMIDGHESLICVEAEHDMVDVYSYTSMAVAALKVQARRIEELQATVDKLQRNAANKPRHATQRR